MKKAARFLGCGALVGVLVTRIDWAQVGRAFRGMDLSLWLAAVALFVGCQALSTWRWQLMSGVLGFVGGWTHYLAIYFVGMFFNLALPTSVGGDAVRAWYLTRLHGKDAPLGRRTSAVVSVLADRLSGLAMLVLLTCVAALLSPPSLPGWIHTCVAGIGLASLGGVTAAGVFAYALRSRPRLAAGGPLRRLRHLVEAGSLYVRRPGVLSAALTLGFLIQVLNVAVIWLVSEGLGLEVSLGYYCLIVPLVTLLTLIPVSISGVGLREGGYVLLLAPLGVSSAQAVALSLLCFAAVAASSVPGLVIYLRGGWRREGAAWQIEESDEDQNNDLPFRGGSDQGRARQPAAAA